MWTELIFLTSTIEKSSYKKRFYFPHRFLERHRKRLDEIAKRNKNKRGTNPYSHETDWTVKLNENKK